MVSMPGRTRKHRRYVVANKDSWDHTGAPVVLLANQGSEIHPHPLESDVSRLCAVVIKLHDRDNDSDLQLIHEWANCGIPLLVVSPARSKSLRCAGCRQCVGCKGYTRPARRTFPPATPPESGETPFRFVRMLPSDLPLNRVVHLRTTTRFLTAAAFLHRGADCAKAIDL